MHVWLDMTFEQIGRELQIARATVHDRWQRALDNLKKATE
jgi:DNA-directed RNA polymerase specialized sigma24 family protein